MDGTKNKNLDIPKRISDISELAYNSWWSLHPEARMLFKMIDRASWKLSVHNPVKMLHIIDNTILKNAAKESSL